MKKDSGLRIRVQRDLRDKFVEACREQDKPAAQVIREFMREYVAKHQDAAEETPTITYSNKNKAIAGRGKKG